MAAVIAASLIAVSCASGDRSEKTFTTSRVFSVSFSKCGVSLSPISLPVADI